jgi:hypothetical protein
MPSHLSSSAEEDPPEFSSVSSKPQGIGQHFALTQAPIPFNNLQRFMRQIIGNRTR